jgi:hypothetical protein
MARTILPTSIACLRRRSPPGRALLALHLAIASTTLGAAVTWAPPAHAEEPSPAEAVILVLAGVPESLDPERLRAAIARELGASVTRADEAPSGANTLTLHTGAGKHVRLTYRAEDGRVIEREIDLPAEPDRAEELIALLAGNLVRNEAAELGAALKKKAEKPPVPAPLPAAKPPPPPAPSVAARPPCAREGLPRSLVGVDFLPFVGTSTFLGVGTSRRLSLNILGGYTAALEGVEAGGLVNIDAEFTCGLQMAGLANLTFGPLRGAQLAGVVNVAAGPVSGAQIGLVNIAGGRVRGAQIGLVNVATDSTFSLGLINIFRDGRLHLDLWGQESGLLMAGIKHGSGHFHNIYGVGVLPFGDHARFAVALGLGAHLSLSDRLFLDLDAIDHALFDPAEIDATLNLAQARAVLGARLLRRLAVYGGPSYNVATSSDGRTPTLSPYGTNFTGVGGKIVAQGWPGIILGIQAF